MITDEDVKKLKGIFATKDDLKSFATKDDLKSFATKDDLLEVKEEIGDLRVEVGDLKDDMKDMKHTLGRIENTLDKMAGSINDLWTENRMGAGHLARHDRQIEALATHAGIKLPE